MRISRSLSLGTILVCLVLLSLADTRSSTSGEEHNPQKSALAEKLFPDARLAWEKSFEGDLEDLVVSRRSGHVALATLDKKSHQGKVYFFSPRGKLLWDRLSKTSTRAKRVGSVSIQVSESGETVLVDWWSEGGGERLVLDTAGKLLFRGKVDEGASEGALSPQGGYSSVSGEHLRTRDGKDVDLRPAELEKNWEVIGYTFLSDSLVAVLAGQEVPRSERDEAFRNRRPIPKKPRSLLFLSLPGATLRWKVDLQEGGSATVRYLDGRVLIQGTLAGSGPTLKLVKKDGQGLWETKPHCRGTLHMCPLDYVSTFGSGRYVAVFVLNTQLSVLDLRSGEYLAARELPPEGALCRIFSFMALGNRLYLSGHTTHRDIPRTYVWTLRSTGNIQDESQEEGLVIGSEESQRVLTVTPGAGSSILVQAMSGRVK